MGIDLKKEILVSILIPAYNVSNKIDRLIESLNSQDYKNIEIIIVDNNSTDDTLKILKNHSRKYKNIKILSEKNQGPNYARKKAFDNSKGAYVYFVDADDFLEKSSISHFVKCIKETNADVVLADYNELDENYKFIKRMYGGPNTKINLKQEKNILLYKPSLCIKLIKRELITEDSFVFTYIGEDINISLLALAKAQNIRHIPKVVYNYVIGRNGLSHKVNFEKLNESFVSLKHLLNNFINYNLYDKYKEEIDYIILTHTLYRTFESELLNDKKERNVIRGKTINLLKDMDYKNNKYYKKSKVYKLVNYFIGSEFLYNLFISRFFIKLLYTNKFFNNILKKLDK